MAGRGLVALRGDVSILALGNPIIASGPFYEAFANPEGWNNISISCFDTTNFVGVTLERLLDMSPDELDVNQRSYLISRRYVAEKYREWGPDHPLFVSRCLGRFPEFSESSLVNLAWLEAAKVSTASTPKAPIRCGLDVAGPGDNLSVLVGRRGKRIIFFKAWAQADPRGEVVAALAPLKESGELESVNTDSAGLGWGMHCHLLELGFPSNPVNVGESPSDNSRFVNLRSELFWNLRLRLEDGDVSGLVDDRMISQLAGLRYKHDPRGRVQLESKDEARRRGVKSPDFADAVCLAYAETPGGQIYARSFTDEMIYDPAAVGPGFGMPGTYGMRVIAVGYGSSFPMVFLEILDNLSSPAVIHVAREYWFDGASSTPKTDKEYIDDLEQFIQGTDPITARRFAAKGRSWCWCVAGKIQRAFSRNYGGAGSITPKLILNRCRASRL